MRFDRLVAVLVAVIAGCVSLMAQKMPDLENGFKSYGSYDGSHLDTVNLQNGNLMLHAPLLPNYSQRGAFSLQDILVFNSKTWQVVCRDLPFNGGIACGWFYGGTGVALQRSVDLAVQRTDNHYATGTGVGNYSADGYSITSPDGAVHQLYVTVTGTASPMEMESVDTSGYHLVMSGTDENGVPNVATVTDRHGNQYVATFASFGSSGSCGGPLPTNHLPPARIGGGLVEPIIDDAPMGDQYCPQIRGAYKVTDSNGNFLSLFDPATSAPGVDTLGRGLPLETGTVAPDNSGCTTASSTYTPWLVSYSAPDGTSRQMKLCFADTAFQTAFNVTLNGGTPVAEGQGKGFIGPNPPQAPNVLPAISAVILADGTKWTFTYDGYGEVTNVTLPTGGSISYTWTTISHQNSCSGLWTNWSRAVATRTLNDGLGHSFTWTYTWGTTTNGVTSNLVTDPLGNDSAHVFTALDGTSGCAFYETSTQYYQGAKAAGHLLKQVDTTYYPVLLFATYSAEPAAGNFLAKDITTTVYPSGKVSRIHREYDTGLGTGKPIFGNVVKELEYDWGQGQPGPLLRETDTVYQWQKNSTYLTAHLLDLPASVVVISPNAPENIKSGCPINSTGGTANCATETDYSYDEATYLTTPTPA